MPENGLDTSGLKEISSVLCNIGNTEQMTCFLCEILTPAECKDLSLRWQLMKMLAAGVPQRQIAKELGISLCKITRGAKILKQDHSISQHYLNTGDPNEPKNPS